MILRNMYSGKRNRLVWIIGLDFMHRRYFASRWPESDDRWMKSWDSCVIKEKQRWQGMMTLPRELEYRDGKIWQKPVREIENYRKNRCCYENVNVGGQGLQA